MELSHFIFICYVVNKKEEHKIKMNAEEPQEYSNPQRYSIRRGPWCGAQQQGTGAESRR